MTSKTYSAMTSRDLTKLRPQSVAVSKGDKWWPATEQPYTSRSRIAPLQVPFTQRLENQSCFPVWPVTCDHDHWHRWLVWEPKRRCLWAPKRILSGRRKDLRSCGDGSLYHHLCNLASCICLKAEEQQRPRLKKQVCSPFSKLKRGKEPHWKPLFGRIWNLRPISDQLPIPNSNITPIVNTKYHRTKPRWKTLISILSCFSGGVFIGACFLDLVPGVEQIFQQVFR